jgi:predicted nucleic acid-binding protein
VGTLIDTSVLIAAERGELNLDALLGSRGDEAVAISAVTASELMHGIHRAKTAVGRARAEVLVERLIGLMPVVPFDLDVARVHARLSAELATKGTPVGAHDLMIAATAVTLGFAVATRDRRSFPKIRGLALQAW